MDLICPDNLTLVEHMLFWLNSGMEPCNRCSATPYTLVDTIEQVPWQQLWRVVTISGASLQYYSGVTIASEVVTILLLPHRCRCCGHDNAAASVLQVQ